MPLAPALNAVQPSIEFDRRGEARTPYRGAAQLISFPPAVHAHRIDVRVSDYSETGIGIIHSEGLLVGQLYVVREPTITAGHTCLYSVIRSEVQLDGSFSIGLRAVRTIADERRDPFTRPAPGISTGSKVLFLIYAAAGAAVITMVGVLFR